MSDQEKIAGLIAVNFLGIQNQLKIYHWHTKSYARHKASDRLFLALSKKIDKFVETMQGAWNLRIGIHDATIPLTPLTDETVVTFLNLFKSYLQEELPTYLHQEDTGLLNLRDEILSEVNIALYLFTLQK